jgi:histidine triad (HIT) family protein
MNFYRDEVLSGNTKVNIVLETANTLAFHHTRPYYPVHIVVIPKVNIDSLVTLEDENLMLELIKSVQTVAKQMLEEHGAAKVTTNLGAYQDTKYLHFHVGFGQPLR